MLMFVVNLLLFKLMVRLWIYQMLYGNPPTVGLFNTPFHLNVLYRVRKMPKRTGLRMHQVCPN